MNKKFEKVLTRTKRSDILKLPKEQNVRKEGERMTLRELREKARLSIEEAANKLGIAYDYLVMLENNRRKPSWN